MDILTLTISMFLKEMSNKQLAAAINAINGEYDDLEEENIAYHFMAKNGLIRRSGHPSSSKLADLLTIEIVQRMQFKKEDVKS